MAEIFAIRSKNLVTGEIKDFYVTKLSEYNIDEENDDIVRVAKIDDEYVNITSVINHKFVPNNSTRRTNLQFLLTWEDDSEPKWYPWNATLEGMRDDVTTFISRAKIELICVSEL